MSAAVDGKMRTSTQNARNA